jgi:hypothetical protein
MYSTNSALDDTGLEGLEVERHQEEIRSSFLLCFAHLVHLYSSELTF